MRPLYIPPFCKIFLSNSTAFVIAHRSSTSAQFLCSRTHCVRRSERSSCGCTGVSLSDSTGHGDKRGQIFYKNTNRFSLALAGERSWRICFNGSLSVKRIELLYSVVKEHERRKSSFLYTALEKRGNVTKIQNFFRYQYKWNGSFWQSTVDFLLFHYYLYSKRPFAKLKWKNFNFFSCTIQGQKLSFC